MNKEGCLIVCLVLPLVILASFVQAADLTSNLTVNNSKKYDIELISLDYYEIIFKVNGETRTVDYDSSQPYYFNSFSSSQKEIKLVPIKRVMSNSAKVGSSLNTLIAVELNLTSDSQVVNLTADGRSYQVELVSAIDGKAIIKVINETSSETKEIGQQSSPYTPTKLDGLKIVVKKSEELPLFLYATLLVMYEHNFTTPPLCYDECSALDERICSGNGYKVCGNFDADICLEWSNITACSDGEICSNGQCINNSGGIQCSKDLDCRKLATGSPYCEGNSVCISSISYKCINPGTTESYCDETPTKSCSLCQDGCQNNQCINGSSPNPIPIKECNSIGLRENGKYCSPEYALIIQKISRISCENSFECKSNICTNGKCTTSIIPPNPNPSSNYKMWIIGAIIVLVVLAILIGIAIKKKQ